MCFVRRQQTNLGSFLLLHLTELKIKKIKNNPEIHRFYFQDFDAQFFIKYSKIVFNTL
jgi:hypothetical protein